LLLFAFHCAAAGASQGTGAGAPLDSVPVYGYELVDTYYHDSDAFTQGLYYKDGYLYESTGLLTHSTVRKVVPETGSIVKIHYMPDSYFGEGLTIRDGIIHQLTYRNMVALTYVELDTFALVDSFPYPRYGWGLTHDDTSLIASNGTSQLFHLNPQNYVETRRFSVWVDGELQRNMNEMEYIQGRIYANIYGIDSVAIIVPETGIVEGWIDLSGLRSLISSGGVLNGIAWDAENSRMFVTGKTWTHLFVIRAEPLNYPPEIVDSSPPPSICTEVDSTVVLSVSATDINAGDVLEYSWTINGITDPAAQDSFYTYMSSVPTVDTVVVEVSDGMFSDSTSWLIVVSTSGVDEDFDAPGGIPPDIKPNPFSASTMICFSVPHGPGATQPVEITIHDVQGRKVRTLLSSRLEPGEHTVRWDGTDSRGTRITAGIYLCTVKVGGSAVSRKVAVLE
jgi:glutaminyl-peptide cyclotransferase